MENFDFRLLALEAAKIADDKKALNTVVLDIKDLTAIADYLVITTAESAPQIAAVRAEIEKKFKEQDVYLLRREGRASASWRVAITAG